MSAPTVTAKGGVVRVTNPDLDFEDLEAVDFDAAIKAITVLREAVAEWSARDKAADEDWDARRVVAFETSHPAAQSAADAVRDAAGFTLTPEAALALADALAVHAAVARQQEHAAEPVRFTSPMLRRA